MQHAGPLTLGAQGVANSVIRPQLPAATAPPTPAQTFFVLLVLRQNGSVVDRNVYWLSTQPDIVNWKATVENPQATMSQYADLTGLQDLPKATISVTASTSGAKVGGTRVTSVTVTNTSQTPSVAFFLRADVRRGAREGLPDSGDNEVLPVLWSGNDTSLWPGESETLSAASSEAALDGRSPVVTVSGWNVETVGARAP